MIFAAGAATAQIKDKTQAVSTHLYFPKKQAGKSFQPVPAIQSIPLHLIPVPANFYATQLGYFCKKEIKFEKVTKIPFKFRLGSVEQCDWLEGKRSY